MTFPGPRPRRAPAHPVLRRWAGAAVLATACSLSLAACGGDAADPVPVSDSADPPAADGSATDPSTGSAAPSPSDDATGSPTTKPSSSASPEGTTVPLYFAGDAPRGTALFREFQRVDGDPLTEAARIVAGNGSPGDPDYRTLWPPMEISSVQATDGVLLVEVPGDAFTERPDGMSRRVAKLALQQLVYTLQGVQQERVPVQVQRADGATLFGLPTGVPMSAASPMRTLNLVNITAPAEGDTITGRDVLTVSGNANSFEASGPCRLLQGGQELTLRPYALDGWAEDRLFPFQLDIPLDGISGEVTLQCETDDPSGGAEGNGPAIDTKTITIG